jgi:hypothetical protein
VRRLGPIGFVLRHSSSLDLHLDLDPNKADADVMEDLMQL